MPSETQFGNPGSVHCTFLAGAASAVTTKRRRTKNMPNRAVRLAIFLTVSQAVKVVVGVWVTCWVLGLGFGFLL